VLIWLWSKCQNRLLQEYSPTDARGAEASVTHVDGLCC
jgi:hypothetical protein